MQSSVMIRSLFVLGLVLLGAWVITPSVIYFRLSDEQLAEVQKDTSKFKTHLPSWAPEAHIVPGLDLQGGVHMVLGVDLDKAISDRARRTSNRMRTDFEEKKLEGVKVDHLADEGKGERVRATFAKQADVDTFEKDLAENYLDLELVKRDGLVYTWRVHPQIAKTIRSDAVDQTIKTVTNRIDKMHVTEPSISRRGDSQVQVQLPGFANPEEAKALIGRTAQLEFQMCDDEDDFLTKLTDLPSWAQLQTSGYQRKGGGYAQDIYLEFPEENLNDLRRYLAGKVPSGLVVKFGKENRRDGEAQKFRTYTLKAEVTLTGDDLVNAQVGMGSPESPQPQVSIEFSPTGRRLFGDLTTKNVGKRMAIVLEDIVDSAPVINEPITGGSASISMGGSRTREEMLRDANQLSIVLKSGALPAPITFREERSVGPSLGKDALQTSKVASLVGAILVALFMLVVYRMGGLFAMIAAFLNVFFVLAALSFFGGSLSLPGIAGLLLTVGMAVDANIIINERIREELMMGKTARSAVDAGYNSAFTAILDSNVTSALAGAVCLQFGSGPVQNFAITLLIGIVSTMFTAVFVTRILFDLYTMKDRDTLMI